jgi:uncharacterized membrane protein YgaE (UPF0421/DUF939 family)
MNIDKDSVIFLVIAAAVIAIVANTAFPKPIDLQSAIFATILGLTLGMLFLLIKVFKLENNIKNIDGNIEKLVKLVIEEEKEILSEEKQILKDEELELKALGLKTKKTSNAKKNKKK